MNAKNDAVTPNNPPTPEYVVCPKCGGDRFTGARRMYLLPLAGGDKQRNWAAGENTSDEIVCSSDQTRLRWNKDLSRFDIFPPL